MTDDVRTIRRALISVYHKDGLDALLAALVSNGVQLLSTGGTHDYILSKGYSCQRVEEVTGYPSVLGGRVKTLHPKIFGGILARRGNASDSEEMARYDMPAIDLVVVDLYPFAATVASGASEDDIIEKIDIGGITLIRAAAKNCASVVIVANKDQYAPLCEIIAQQGAATTLAQRQHFATAAFATTASYDAAIHAWFAENDK